MNPINNKKEMKYKLTLFIVFLCIQLSLSAQWQVQSSGIRFPARYSGDANTSHNGAISLGVPTNSYNVIRADNGAAIHFFHTNWQSGQASKSAGALNIQGNTGVSIGTWDNTTAFFRRSDGFVGIGTTNPAEKLHVNGTASITGSIGQVSSGNYWSTGKHTLELYGSSGSDVVLSFHRGGYNSGFIKFAEKNGATGLTLSAKDGVDEKQLFIQENGNIGIGTSTPDERLFVNGTTSIVSNLGQITSGNYYNPGQHTLELNGSSGSDVVLSFHRGGQNSGFIKFAEKNGVTGLTLSAKDGANEQQVFIKENGNIGIGTLSPEERLHVNGTATIGGSIGQVTSGDYYLTGNHTMELYGSSGSDVVLSFHRGGQNSGFIKFAEQNGVTGLTLSAKDGVNERQFFLEENGNVGIGTVDPTEKLSVDGRISAEEIILEDVAGADFVFEADYDLRSLEETEQFINANKHLPEIPSAAEMAEEGLQIKEMNILLLQKVEELTLHLIRQEKQMKTMNDENSKVINELKDSVLELRSQVSELSKN